jgi:hypothetical protein
MTFRPGNAPFVAHPYPNANPSHMHPRSIHWQATPAATESPSVGTNSLSQSSRADATTNDVMQDTLAHCEYAELA